jgi:predicted  nucleic acid-binding Zn-ribbon protein
LNKVSSAYDQIAKIHGNPESYMPKGDYLVEKQKLDVEINQLKNLIDEKERNLENAEDQISRVQQQNEDIRNRFNDTVRQN